MGSVYIYIYIYIYKVMYAVECLFKDTYVGLSLQLTADVLVYLDFQIRTHVQGHVVALS
jgi:hypothetical protein